MTAQVPVALLYPVVVELVLAVGYYSNVSGNLTVAILLTACSVINAGWAGYLLLRHTRLRLIWSAVAGAVLLLLSVALVGVLPVLFPPEIHPVLSTAHLAGVTKSIVVFVPIFSVCSLIGGAWARRAQTPA